MTCFSYRPDFTGNKIICAILFYRKDKGVFHYELREIRVSCSVFRLKVYPFGTRNTLHITCRKASNEMKHTQKISPIFFQLANLSSLGYPCKWEWLGPGGLPGL